MKKYLLLATFPAIFFFILKAQAPIVGPIGNGGSSTSSSAGHYIWSGSGGPNGTDYAPHNMTTDNLPSPYHASASGSGCCSGAEFRGSAFQGFDGNTATLWGPDNNMTSVIFSIDLGATVGTPIANYTINSTPNGGVPQEGQPTGWNFDGSANGSTWVTLDTRAAVNWLGLNIITLSPTIQTTAYRYYRLAFATWNANEPVINEFYLFGTPFTSGVNGDIYLDSIGKAFYGPRPTSTSPVWPLIGTLN